MQDPLKQGLKQKKFKKADEYAQIRMQDPLKQGLKQNSPGRARGGVNIRMQDPLKQGLKHFYFVTFDIFTLYSNARSIKTRIETLLVRLLLLFFSSFECKIH